MKKKQIFNRTFFELTGCIHNHSEHSYDGFISLARIIREAKLRELDYITINDHNSREAAREHSVMSEQDLIVIVGMEINDPNRDHHLLVFNSDEVMKNKDVEEYAKFYREKAAVSFAAHPIERRKCARFRKYEWLKKEVTDFDGIEIWNYLSEWIGKMKPKMNGLFMVLFPSFFINKPYPEVLQWWDELNVIGERKSAIGSVDAHTESMVKFGIRFKFLRHRTLFKAIRTNLLIENSREINSDTILNALKNGNSYIVNYKIGNPYNFFAGIANQKVNAILGEDIKFREGLKYFFRIPQIAKVTLIRNGEKIASQTDEIGNFDISRPGNYRLEITKFGRGWIYTNNIYVVE